MSRYFRKLIQTEGGKFPLINPYTNQIIHELPFQSLEDRISTLHLCSQKMDSFKSLSKSERIAMLENVLKILQNEKQIFSQMITESTGKPITQSRQEFDHMIEHSQQFIDIFNKDLELFNRNQVSIDEDVN